MAMLEASCKFCRNTFTYESRLSPKGVKTFCSKSCHAKEKNRALRGGLDLPNIRSQEELTVEDASKFFSYDSITGVVTRLVPLVAQSYAGDPVGTSKSRGYLHVRFCGMAFLLHRLAWLLHYGEWPKGVIDHINRNTSDNRIENLRDTTPAINILNTGVRENSKTGVTGVTWRERDKRFYAACKRNYKQNYLGSFDTIEAAKSAIEKFKEQIGEMK